MRSDFAQLSGVPGSSLTDDELAQLPPDSAPAPWKISASALIWVGRPDAAARAAIADVVPDEISRGATLVSTVGALINYLYTPVGRYSEIIGMVIYRRGATVFGHVPFIAVDSPVSVVGGRTNWALPKTLATFEGRPADRVPLSAEGPSWRVDATARASRIPLPVVSPKLMSMVQLAPHGALWSVRPSAYGMARPARVDVRITSEAGLADWFPVGTCTGALGARLHASLDRPAEQLP